MDFLILLVRTFAFVMIALDSRSALIKLIAISCSVIFFWRFLAEDEVPFSHWQ